MDGVSALLVVGGMLVIFPDPRLAGTLLIALAGVILVLRLLLAA